MIAIDTNVVVRYLTGDHAGQSAKAKALIENTEVFVPKSVVLETEWVLRSAYGVSNDAARGALLAFAGLPGVTVEDAPAVAKALDWMANGMDFADALHLASASTCDAFVSFDRKLAKVSHSLGLIEVRAP